MSKKHDQVNANIRAAMSRNRLFVSQPAAPPPEPGTTQGNAGQGSTAGEFPKTRKLTANEAIRKAAGWTYDPYEGS